MANRAVLSAMAGAAAGERTTGRQAWGLLWAAGRPLPVLVLCWLVAGALSPALVVGALGVVVGEVPAAITHGFGSPAGHLALALVVAAVLYALSLVNDPVGTALGTAAKARITGTLQARLLASVSRPVGVAHWRTPPCWTGWPGPRAP